MASKDVTPDARFARDSSVVARGGAELLPGTGNFVSALRAGTGRKKFHSGRKREMKAREEWDPCKPAASRR